MKTKELKYKIEYALCKKHIDKIIKIREWDWDDRQVLEDLLDKMKLLELSLGITEFKNVTVSNYLNPRRSLFMWVTGKINEDTFEIKIVPDDIFERNYDALNSTISIIKNKKLVFEAEHSSFSGYDKLKYNPNEIIWIVRLSKTFHLNDVYVLFHSTGRLKLYSDGYHYSPEYLE